MDWEWSRKKDWSNEDEVYARKRNVSNKGSREHEHVIGKIYSCKMKRGVQYESLWGECLFYYLLELDPLTVRYYEQPVIVPLQTLTIEYELKQKGHVPDVLTFRDGYRPHLYQIKGGDKEVEQNPLTFEACKKYATERGWDYSVVHPKLSIPLVIRNNILFLMNYLEPRHHFKDWLPELHYRLMSKRKWEIYSLAKSFEIKVDHRAILPIIYHLVAKGVLRVDLSSKIDHTSEVSFGSVFQEIDLLFSKRGNKSEVI